MNSRRSGDPGRHSIGSQNGDREGLIHAYDEEEAAGFGLTDLAEESDDDLRRPSNGHANGRVNGSKAYPNGNDIEMENRRR